MEYVKAFEDQFDADSAHSWLRNNFSISIYAAIFYVLSIHLLQRYMLTHERVALRYSLSVWSFLLAAFSSMGAYYSVRYMVPKVWYDGIKSAACDETYAHNQTGLWLFLFVISKLPELVDTYFIIFRKGPLIFLHWYHHATVLMYCWFSYSERAFVTFIFSAINYVIHAIMYTYYGLKARQVYIPRQVNILITSIQIAQMVFGLYIGVFIVVYRVEMKPCGVSTSFIFYTLTMYMSYFILFAIFFYNAYIKTKRTSASETNGHKTVHTNGVDINHSQTE